MQFEPLSMKIFQANLLNNAFTSLVASMPQENLKEYITAVETMTDFAGTFIAPMLQFGHILVYAAGDLHKFLTPFKYILKKRRNVAFKFQLSHLIVQRQEQMQR